jgi:very-short-patch-repair endonuclease
MFLLRKKLFPLLGGGLGEGIMNFEEANKKNHYSYNKNLKEYARENRNSMTKAEACLWKYVLRARMMKGYGFRRQRPVLNYIADFMCKELLLIIEVDGITHHFEETIQKDKIRQQKLEQAGFTVIRFPDNEVLQNIETVRQQLLLTIEQIEQKQSLPPSPSGRGIRY